MDMKNKNTYILFLFAMNENQDEFVKMMGNELSIVASSPDVRYYYGPQSSVFVFTSNDTFNEISEMLTIMFEVAELTYMFLPLDRNNMTSGFGKTVDKHLFGDKPLTNDSTNITNAFKAFKEDFDEFAQMCEDDYDDEIVKLKRKSKPYVPSVNDILDKIRITGISSITIEEKTILDNYSKQL
jgi:hypothetical protein